MSAAVDTRAACIAVLLRYRETLTETDAIAREQIAGVLGDVDGHLVPALLESARATIAYVERVSAFVDRARRGEVALDDLTRAAEAAGELLG